MARELSEEHVLWVNPGSQLSPTQPSLTSHSHCGEENWNVKLRKLVGWDKISITISQGVGYPLVSWGQLSWLCTLPPSDAPPAYLLAGQHEKQGRPWCCVSTAQQQLQHQCIINAALITNLKHSTMWTAMKKLTPSQAKPIQNDISKKSTSNIKVDFNFYFIVSSVKALNDIEVTWIYLPL